MLSAPLTSRFWVQFGHKRKWLPYRVDTEARYLVRRGGLEPPRCYPLSPQASASANSAISAFRPLASTILLLRWRLLLRRSRQHQGDPLLFIRLPRRQRLPPLNLAQR